MSNKKISYNETGNNFFNYQPAVLACGGLVFVI